MDGDFNYLDQKQQVEAREALLFWNTRGKDWVHRRLMDSGLTPHQADRVVHQALQAERKAQDAEREANRGPAIAKIVVGGALTLVFWLPFFSGDHTIPILNSRVFGPRVGALGILGIIAGPVLLLWGIIDLL